MITSTDYEQIELYISCRQLKDLDFVGKSDPKVKFHLKNPQGHWVSHSETETLQDNLNPDFQRTFQVDFIFEAQQEVKFEVYDVDTNTGDDLIGFVDTSIGAIMGARKQTQDLEIQNHQGKKTGRLIVRGDRVGQSKNNIHWQWTGIKVLNVDGWFGNSDPFLRFFKVRPQGDTLLVHETEFIKNNCSPVWAPCKISEDKLCGGNHSQPIRIECWDDQADKNFRYIGTVELTIDQIKNGQTQFTLHNEKKKKDAGNLVVTGFKIEERFSFIDYLRGGVQLSLIAAIDFTGSNGVPTQPDSLHAIKKDGSLNEYQKVLSSVGQILLNYDYDRQIPVFGFGGKPKFPSMNPGQVSHCFPCSGNADQPLVNDLQGVMDVYANALHHVELSGPTYFAPIIKEAVKHATANKGANNGVYNILLILTDGEIHDMDETKDIIVASALLPISIVIVGVGQANFDKMTVLDGDSGLVSTKGQKTARDFVQFVAFRNFKDMASLSQQILAEIPNQVVDYYTMIGQKPRPPPTH